MTTIGWQSFNCACDRKFISAEALERHQQTCDVKRPALDLGADFYHDPTECAGIAQALDVLTAEMVRPNGTIGGQFVYGGPTRGMGYRFWLNHTPVE